MSPRSPAYYPPELRDPAVRTEIDPGIDTLDCDVESPSVRAMIHDRRRDAPKSLAELFRSGSRGESSDMAAGYADV